MQLIISPQCRHKGGVMVEKPTNLPNYLVYQISKIFYLACFC